MNIETGFAGHHQNFRPCFMFICAPDYQLLTHLTCSVQFKQTQVMYCDVIGLLAHFQVMSSKVRKSFYPY